MGSRRHGRPAPARGRRAARPGRGRPCRVRRPGRAPRLRRERARRLAGTGLRDGAGSPVPARSAGTGRRGNARGAGGRAGTAARPRRARIGNGASRRAPGRLPARHQRGGGNARCVRGRDQRMAGRHARPRASPRVSAARSPAGSLEPPPNPSGAAPDGLHARPEHRRAGLSCRGRRGG